MAINFDWFWILEPNGASRVRKVYRGDNLIGRVRRQRKGEDALIREWFTAERKRDAFYEPIPGERATFKEALEQVVMHGVAH